MTKPFAYYDPTGGRFWFDKDTPPIGRTLWPLYRADSTELLQAALEVLEDSPYLSNKDDYRRLEQTIAAIRQHLENKA